MDILIKPQEPSNKSLSKKSKICSFKDGWVCLKESKSWVSRVDDLFHPILLAPKPIESYTFEPKLAEECPLM